MKKEKRKGVLEDKSKQETKIPINWGHRHLLTGIAHSRFAAITLFVILVALVLTISYNIFGTFERNVSDVKTESLLKDLIVCIDKPIEDVCIQKIAQLEKEANNLPSKQALRIRLARGELSVFLFSRLINKKTSEIDLQDVLLKWAVNHDYIKSATVYQPISEHVKEFQLELKKNFLKGTIND